MSVQSLSVVSADEYHFLQLQSAQTAPSTFVVLLKQKIIWLDVLLERKTSLFPCSDHVLGSKCCSKWVVKATDFKLSPITVLLNFEEVVGMS
jgi:hypothetical protein